MFKKFFTCRHVLCATKGDGTKVLMLPCGRIRFFHIKHATYNGAFKGNKAWS